MKNLLDKPVSVCPTQLSNLFQTIFNEVPDKEIDQLNPLHSHMSMAHFDKKFSTGILFARFQYTELDGALYESTDINDFHFAPQNDSALISATCLCDVNDRNESEFKIHKSQRSKANSTIEGIGRVNDIEDLIKVCANLCAIQCKIADVQGGGFPFLHKFSIKIILCIHNPAFQQWYSKNNSKLSHLHFIFLQGVCKWDRNTRTLIIPADEKHKKELKALSEQHGLKMNLAFEERHQISTSPSPRTIQQLKC
jgi:hypothetical protein